MHAFLLLAAADTNPAGGAAIGQVVIASTAAFVVTAALLWLGYAHRTGRTSALRRVAAAMARASGLAEWAALPSIISALSLLTALFGMYWDISFHIDNGRDPGPLANPAHYFILVGLFGIFTAGFLAVVLPDGRPSRAAVRVAGDWYAPLSGVALLSCAAFSLSGFPLDDMWHRLFGQDVTLWGPTHLMLIGGAGLALIGSSMLVVEGKVSAPRGARAQGLLGFLTRTRYAALAGGFLVGLSTFQAEFDFGVPQYRLLFHPVLIAAAAAIALTAARIYAGRGGALSAAAYFLVIRGVITLLVGPILGKTTPHLPLYAVEAAAVEAAALAVVPTRRPYLFGTLSGLLIGTVGFAAEFAWSHAWMPVPWPSVLFGEAIVPVLVTAVAGGLIGAFVGSTLGAPRRGTGQLHVPVIAGAALGLAGIAAVFVYGLDTTPATGVRGSVALKKMTAPPNRTVQATVRIDPPGAARDADWLSAIAWQGGGLVVDRLDHVGPGVWRTTKPLPVHGKWKTLIRLHSRRSLIGLPIYLPEDRAIPAREVPALSRFTRRFELEKNILQREQKSGVPPALPTLAYAAVGSITLGLILMLGWALARFGATAGDGGSRRRRVRRPSAGRLAEKGAT